MQVVICKRANLDLSILTYLKYLIFEKIVFIGNLTESLIRIEDANENYSTFKSIKNIKLSCLNKDSLELSVIINDVLDLSKTKANLIFLGQLREQEVDIKTRDPKNVFTLGNKNSYNKFKN